MTVFHKPIEKRVLTSVSDTSASSGGELVGTDLMGNLYIDALRAALVVRQLGATILTGLTSNVDIPKLNTTATSHWVARTRQSTQATRI